MSDRALVVVARSILRGMALVAAAMLLFGIAFGVFFVVLEVAFAVGLSEGPAILVALLSSPIIPVGIIIGICEAK